MTRALDENVRNFISRNVASMPALDVLVVLARAPRRSWPIVELARDLGSEPTAVRQAVIDLLATDLVMHVRGTTHFKLGGAAEAHDAVLSALVEGYEESRAAIVELLVKRSVERLRILVDAYRDIGSRDRN